MTKIRQIHKILVANRGEIAIRIFRAASEINIRTVAIYTFEDRYSLHRYKADEAYQVGADDDPLKPYLDIDEIIDTAKDCGADAIHPGYGFLSENEQFAAKCQAAGIIWVGPDPETMAELGDKISAKGIARKAGVPIVEATERGLNKFKEVEKAAKEIGLPVMIKAAVGGGGRGMRVVKAEEDLEKLYNEATREATTAFGNGTVFVEKFIENPKHLEVQILGDHHGNIVHLYERDCSVQRRFQKVVEVAPSIGLREETKRKLHQYAVAITSEVGYKNAGTVEFLVDKEENIFFIEVNTRIQVEHTITEVITGFDLVRSQIMVAMGYSLDSHEIGISNQMSISIRGFAIQCRITTEDPSNGFKPDYGRLLAYRSASGFGIRLDAGNAYAGATISPFFDSMLVKVTASGNKLEEAADRLHRALREFRIRGVKANIPFLLNILKDENFRKGNVTVNYIGEHPELLDRPNWKDRGTKMLRYLGEVIVNGNSDVKKVDPSQVFTKVLVPPFENKPVLGGTKKILDEQGPDGIIKYLKNDQRIHFTDTTFRDAHQSLLATRMRTIDMMRVAESFSANHGEDLFSMEVWGGATFDVAMRFLKESPWRRLELLRKAIPNTLLQMLLRGSNAVGYKAYPDNLIEAFVEKSAEKGIDVFRIFDSLNWTESMKTSIKTVRDRTNAIAECCICYTGDVLRTGDNKFNVKYYLDLAKELQEEGAHILAIKDMAGLLKPDAATELIGALKAEIDIPIHLHTHDTSSIQSTTYLKAIDAGVDIVDVAISSMSGLTSQPNFNSVVAMLDTHERNPKIDLKSLNQYSTYWEAIRRYYYPFETELKAGTAEVYDHEIPGGQYSNLRPQARGMGLEDQFETIKKNYQDVNELLGGIVKVTPSSKVIGDMAMFLTSNGMTVKDLEDKGEEIAFPDSMINLMEGELGQWKFGWPKAFQSAVLKDKKPFTEKPNAYLEPLDLDGGFESFIKDFPEANTFEDFLSYCLYPKVFKDYHDHLENFGSVQYLPTPAFFYGLKPNEEIMVTIAKGKTVIVEFLDANEADQQGNRLVIFRLNGTIRSIVVKDQSIDSTVAKNLKVSNDNHVGSPLQGSLTKILVKEGQEVERNQPLFTIEAMKMESTITSNKTGKVGKIFLDEKTLVEQDDLVMSIQDLE